MLGGCASIPAKMATASVTPGEVHDAIVCEIAYAASAGAASLSDWVAAMQLEVKQTDTIDLKPGLTASASSGNWKWSVPASSQFNDVREGIAVLKYQELQLHRATNECPEAGSPAAPRGLGLAAWLDGVGRNMSHDSSGGGDLDSLDYSVTFTVTRSIGGGLVFESDHVKVALDENTLSRENKNTLTIKFKKGGKNPAAVARALQQQITEERLAPTVIQLKDNQTVVIQ